MNKITNITIDKNPPSWLTNHQDVWLIYIHLGLSIYTYRYPYKDIQVKDIKVDRIIYNNKSYPISEINIKDKLYQVIRDRVILKLYNLKEISTYKDKQSITNLVNERLLEDIK
jgi:hypothetical protein